MLEYAWDEQRPHVGWVDPRQFKTFLEKGQPESYSGGIGGRSVRHISVGVMAKLVEAMEFDDNRGYRVNLDHQALRLLKLSDQLGAQLGQRGSMGDALPGDWRQLGQWDHGLTLATEVMWLVTNREAAGRFYTDFIPALTKLGHDKDDVRLVFGFDS